MERNSIGLLGDINLDSNANVSTTRDYLHILQSNAFCNLITKSTQVTSSLQTSIDHTLTNDGESSIKPRVLHYTISDHFPIFCEITISRNKLSSTPLTNPYSCRRTKYVDGSKFRVDLENALLPLADEFMNSNITANNYNLHFNSLLDAISDVI